MRKPKLYSDAPLRDALDELPMLVTLAILANIAAATMLTHRTLSVVRRVSATR